MFESNNIAEERQIEEYTQQESGRGVRRLHRFTETEKGRGKGMNENRKNNGQWQKDPCC